MAIQGFLAADADKCLKLNKMIEEHASKLPSRFNERKKILARYIAILMGHEFLWESNIITEVPSFLTFFKTLLGAIKGDEDLVVS